MDRVWQRRYCAGWWQLVNIVLGVLTLLNIVTLRRGMSDDELDFVVGRFFRCTNLDFGFLSNGGINEEV